MIRNNIPLKSVLFKELIKSEINLGLYPVADPMMIFFDYYP